MITITDVKFFKLYRSFKATLPPKNVPRVEGFLYIGFYKNRLLQGSRLDPYILSNFQQCFFVSHISQSLILCPIKKY